MKAYLRKHLLPAGLLAVLALTGPESRADVIGEPAVCSWGPDRLDVFVRGSDNHLWHKYSEGDCWHGWYDLGGLITSAPACVSWGVGRIDVLARGQDNRLWHKAYVGGNWTSWSSPWGTFTITSAPAAASQGPNLLDVFARGPSPEYRMYHLYWDGNAWSSWHHHGDGVMTSAPAAVARGSNLSIFARGASNSLMGRSFSPTNGWSGWYDHGGVLTSAPAVAAPSTTSMRVLARGSDNALWEKTWGAFAGWSSWSKIGGALGAGPAAVARPTAGRVDVVTRDQNGRARHLYNDGIWHPYWVDLEHPQEESLRLTSLLGTDGVTGLYVKKVDGQVIALRNTGFVFEPASSLKVLPHIHALLDMQNGSSFPNDYIPGCTDPNPADADSCPEPCGGSMALTYALQKMMQDSDNWATNALENHFGRFYINNTAYYTLGMTSTKINHTMGCGGPPGNQSTLLDLCGLYEQVAQGSLLTHPMIAPYFYNLMAGKNYDFTGIWSDGNATDLQDIIYQEANNLGLSTTLRQQFANAVKLTYKAGGYRYGNQTYLALAGWAEFKVCDMGNYPITEQYVFGLFIHGAANDTYAGQRFNATKAELLREPVRSALCQFAATGGSCELHFNFLAAPDAAAGSPSFRRGDADSSGAIDITDAFALLRYLFGGGRKLPCEDAADVNDDGALDVTDVTRLLEALFGSGEIGTGTPFGVPEGDATEDGLGCEAPASSADA